MRSYIHAGCHLPIVFFSTTLLFVHNVCICLYVCMYLSFCEASLDAVVVAAAAAGWQSHSNCHSYQVHTNRGLQRPPPTTTIKLQLLTSASQSSSRVASNTHCTYKLHYAVMRLWQHSPAGSCLVPHRNNNCANALNPVAWWL